MFVVTVTFEVDHEFVSAFYERAVQQANDTLTNETGCSRFDVCSETNRPDRFLFYEIYDSAADFAIHLQTDHFRSFDEHVSSMTRSKSISSWTLSPAA